MATPVHLQYNSPLGLYNRETAEEQFNQQMGGIGGEAPALPNGEKHFDATKSKVLKEIQRGDRDTFGENFAEQIARAETPKMFQQQEPEWARDARERSERARSRTPRADFPPNDPYHEGAVGYPYQHKLGSAADEAREYADKSRTFVHSNQGDHYGPAYYQVQQQPVRPRSRSESAHRGYELGGMDFTGRGGYSYGNPEEHTYVDLRRKERESSERPVAGSDFGSGAIGYGPYHGHGPDPPRLRPKYTADPRAPVNLYVAPNVDSVDGNLLVGDTLSNQKVSPRPHHPDDSTFGTSFAPPQGHKSDHRAYYPPPKPEEPVTYCVSAPKNMYGGYSSAPSHQGDVYRERQATSEKEVSPHTLLTDEALRPRRREDTPDWVNASLSKHDQWKNRSDPRLDRSLEVYYTEPNWKRNVDQRKNAWERKAFETEQTLNRPKAPSSGAPYWANRAEQTHNTWARAADDVHRGYGGQQGGYQGGVQHHDYSNQSMNEHRTYNQQSFPSQPSHFSQPLSVGLGQGQMSTQLHSPGGYSVHTTSQSGDKNTGNYSTSEHFEKEMNEPNRHEKSSYTHSESKYTSVNEVPTQSIPSNTFRYANGGQNISTGSVFNQPTQNYQSSSCNTSSNTQTTRVSSRPHFDTRPLSTHHVANGVETDMLNTGFNENQIRYFEERHAVPTPHHHHSPLPQKTSTSSSTVLPGGGRRYTNFASESSGVPGGKNYSSTEKYTSETTGPTGRSLENSSYTRSEQRSSTQTALPVQWTSSENCTTSTFHDDSKRNETTTSSVPVTRNTTYSYAQQPIASQASPGQTRYEHYSMKKSEEKKEETRPVVIPAPPPVQQETRYERYSSKKHEEKKEETRPVVIPAPPPVQQETRYERYSSNKQEETKTESRPVSQQSNYTESRQQDYHKSSNEKTTTTSTVPRVTTTTSSYLNNDAFDRKAEMSETLPRGSVSNTLNNTEGGYRDHSGHDVSYKRELATSSDPGRDVALLKEEERRVIEKPLEPGVISRHVTTKYYKKKTTTDTTTTTTPTD